MPGAEALLDKMVLFDDGNMGVEDYYRERANAQLKMASPTNDGRNTQLLLMDEMAKAALSTSDTGAINAVYDLAVVLGYATKKNTVGALRKTPWKRQGYRFVTAAGKSSALGIASGGALGAGVKNTYIEVAPTPKEIEYVADYTTRLKVLAAMADGVAQDQDRRIHEKNFWRSLDADLLANYDTVAGNNFEGIMRWISVLGTDEGYTATDEDIYGIDRSVQTAYKSNVLRAAADRPLTVQLINSLRTTVEPYWENDLNDKWYLTGPDTWTRWSELEGAKMRFSNEAFTMTIGDGIKVGPGIQAGGKIATWDGMGVVTDDLIDKTGDTISPVYLMDNQNISLAFGLPPAYNESDDQFVVGHLTRGVWYGIGELYGLNPLAFARLRDLS